MRGTVTDNIESKLGKFLYQTGVSAADSMVMLGVSAVTGIPQIATVSMGMSAASQQAKDIIERGGTNGQAFWGGLAAGAAEALCEKIPLENLLNVKSAGDVKELMTNVFKQQVIEGGEEAVTEIANIISDAVIMGDKSRFNTRVKAYMADGMSETEAKQKAKLDGIGDVALAGAGGFVAGGLTGGIVNTGKYVQSQMQQGGSRGGGTNFASAVGQDANVPARGGMEAVTSDHGGSIQQSGNAQTQTMGNAGTSIGMNVPQTQQGGAKGKTSGNVDAPTAIVGKGGAQTSVLAETQAQTDVQMQAQSQADTQTGKTVKAEGKVTELLQEALERPVDSTAHQTAADLSEQLERALTELGLDASELYRMSRTDQVKLIEQATNEVLSDQTLGELARLVEETADVTQDPDAGTRSGLDDLSKSDTIKPDKIVEGHASTPRDATPGSVIDRVDANGRTNIRTFYGENGRKTTEIHTGNHGNCKTHDFGVNGEHAHDYVWDEDGRLKSKEPRELTENERKGNGDIL